MKILTVIILAVLILLSGCKQTGAAAAHPKGSADGDPTVEGPDLPETFLDSSEVTWTISEDGRYKTIQPTGNKTGIVRHPQAIDFSGKDELPELPHYDPNLHGMGQVDLRSRDISGLNLKDKLNDLLYAQFDSRTIWPSKLPEGYDPERIMETGKNPGLGIRKLHQQGITGKGVGVAIIDQALLVDHVEYKDQIKMYEEIHCGDALAQLHGPAVTSIAVGKSVGVAPAAEVYYIASTFGTWDGKGNFTEDLSWLAMCIDRIVDVNRQLPEDGKIRVISISLGVGSRKWNGSEKALASIEAAKEEGIYTAYVQPGLYVGLNREPMKNPDDFSAYRKVPWIDYKTNGTLLMVPMDSRSVASPTGESDYVFYREGGGSWTVPYVAGLYALACQVKPDVTPELFWEAAASTGVNLYEENSETEMLGKIIDPIALIESLK